MGELGPAQDNRRAIRQRFADRLECFAPHHKDLAGGHFFEPLEILRQMPWDSTARSDDADATIICPFNVEVSEVTIKQSSVDTFAAVNHVVTGATEKQIVTTVAEQ